MAKYEIRMNMIRMGDAAAGVDDTYDPMKDMASHSSSLKVSCSARLEPSSCLSPLAI